MEQLKNQGFEEGMPSNWQVYATDTKHKYCYPDKGINAGSSVAIEFQSKDTDKVAALVQNINIDTTKKYKLSGWMKTENIEGTGASIKIDWKDATGRYIGESSIMSSQTGTIQWTNFEGDITPNKNAAKATIVLELRNCSGKVWFDDISLTDIEIPHPDIFLNKSEVDNINARKDAEPWGSAYSNLIADANLALKTALQSVTFGGKMPPSGDNHDYYSDVPSATANRADYTAASTLGKAIKSLGIAYALTGDANYADKSIELINAWCVNPNTRMTPKFTNFNDQSYIELCITMPAMFYAADLMWNYHNWNASDKDAFRQWTTLILESAKSWSRGNNFENWRLVFISAASVIADDVVSRNYAFDKWKVLIGKQMDTSGKMITEIGRTTSLSYSTYAVCAMIETAEVAKHYGVDLYNFVLPDGRGLEKTLDFHAPYVADPSTWPYKQTTQYKGENAALYELGYTFKKKAAYKDAIVKWTRPMHETRVMGPVTLTHGSAFV